MTRPDPAQTTREAWATNYFNHDRPLHVWQHGHLDEVLDSSPIRASTSPHEWEIQPRELPRRLHLPDSQAHFLGVAPLDIDLDQFLSLSGTTGLLVWRDGAIVDERYLGGHQATTRWMTNSASKLVVAIITAQCQQFGMVGDDETALTTYWPELHGTGWDGVTIGHCLAMTSGVEFTEESLDLEGESDFVELFGEVIAGSMDEYVESRGRRHAPGSTVAYSSLDTQALGGTLSRATGRPLSDLVHDLLWEPGGMGDDAYWVTDTVGREMALAGLCATLRDYARLGVLLLDGGGEQGAQLIPRTFVERLAAPPAELFSTPGAHDYPLVCWNQSFIPHEADRQNGDYMAAGSYGQLIYVHPETRTVIAHQGVYADISIEYIDMYRAFMAFRQIAESLDR